MSQNHDIEINFYALVKVILSGHHFSTDSLRNIKITMSQNRDTENMRLKRFKLNVIQVTSKIKFAVSITDKMTLNDSDSLN